MKTIEDAYRSLSKEAPMEGYPRQWAYFKAGWLALRAELIEVMSVQRGGWKVDYEYLRKKIEEAGK